MCFPLPSAVLTRFLTLSQHPEDPLGISLIMAAYRGGAGSSDIQPMSEGIPGPLHVSPFCFFTCSDTSPEARCCHYRVFAQGADPLPSLYPSRSVISDIGGRRLERTVLEVTVLPVGPRYPDVLSDPR